MNAASHVRPGFSCLSFSRRMLACFALSLFCLLASPLFAQKPRMGSKYPVSILPSGADDRSVIDRGIAAPDSGGACLLEPFPGMEATVSVASLRIPAKAQKEYDKACEDLQSNKPANAQKHLVKATQIFPDYVAGWVLLGQVFESLQQASQARAACSHAAASDAKYLPADLCLAEIAGHEQRWSDVLHFTGLALALDPEGDPYAYFFRAIALFNLDDLSGAESSALRAAQIDKDHHQPLIQYLLSQIYEAKDDSASAASYAAQYRQLISIPAATREPKTGPSPARPGH